MSDVLLAAVMVAFFVLAIGLVRVLGAAATWRARRRGSARPDRR